MSVPLRSGLAAFLLGTASLVVALSVGGGAPQAAPQGIADAGPVVGWGLPLSTFVVQSAIVLVVGLLLGKCLGITGATWLVTRFRGPSLDPTIAWWDLIGLSVLAGIGFTVSLLISELSFAAGSPFGDTAKVAILTGSALAAVLGGTLLSARNYRYRRVHTSHHGQSSPVEKSA